MKGGNSPCGSNELPNANHAENENHHQGNQLPAPNRPDEVFGDQNSMTVVAVLFVLAWLAEYMAVRNCTC
jgi:hypothetical protein